MLTDNRESAYKIMNTIVLQQGINKIRIFNREGIVMFSLRHLIVEEYIWQIQFALSPIPEVVDKYVGYFNTYRINIHHIQIQSFR
jgi:hypothetical protein